MKIGQSKMRVNRAHLPCLRQWAHCAHERRQAQQQRLDQGRRGRLGVVLRLCAASMRAGGVAGTGAVVVGHGGGTEARVSTGVSGRGGSFFYLTMLVALHPGGRQQHCGLVRSQRILLAVPGVMGGVLLVAVSRQGGIGWGGSGGHGLASTNRMGSELRCGVGGDGMPSWLDDHRVSLELSGRLAAGLDITRHASAVHWGLGGFPGSGLGVSGRLAGILALARTGSF